MRQTSLHTVHASHGATFTAFAGWHMPLRYSSEIAEHHAVRQTAGLFDLSHMGQLLITGPQAAAALDFALTTHLSLVPTGGTRYTMLCHDNGGILDDLVVYRLATDRFLAVANARNTPVVLAMLNDRLDGYNAAVKHDPGRSLIALQGPRAAEILGTMASVALQQLRYYTCMSADLAGRPVLLARTGYTGEDGFEIYCADEDAAFLWSRLLERGSPHSLRPAGLACRDTLRLEAGMALHGNELHVGVNPFEAGLGRVVALGKPGDFVGRSALVAHQAAPPTRTLTGLIGGGRRAARTGYAITDVHSGARIGTVTSGALSPTLGRPIALAYLTAGAVLPGTSVAVDIRGTTEVFTVVSPRFYKGQSA